MGSYFKTKKEQEIKAKQIRSFYSSAIFGNEKMFKPRWSAEFALKDPEYFHLKNGPIYMIICL